MTRWAAQLRVMTQVAPLKPLTRRTPFQTPPPVRGRAEEGSAAAAGGCAALPRRRHCHHVAASVAKAAASRCASTRPLPPENALASALATCASLPLRYAAAVAVGERRVAMATLPSYTMLLGGTDRGRGHARGGCSRHDGHSFFLGRLFLGKLLYWHLRYETSLWRPALARTTRTK